MEGGKEKHMRNISDSSVQGAGMVFSNQHTEIAHVLPRHEVYLYVLGFAALGANKIRHALQGYKTPRTFSHKDVEKGIEYIFKVVMEWEENLVEYTGEQNPFGNKDVLEVGPGPDLGTGVILLAKGARFVWTVSLMSYSFGNGSHTPCKGREKLHSSGQKQSHPAYR